MADFTDDRLAEGKLDLVPMIDCIMLLLLFFLLTTKFTSEEKSIDALLPTGTGALTQAQPLVKPPEQVNICIYPAGLDRGLQPTDYAAKVRAIAGAGRALPAAWLRMGKEDPLPIDGASLATGTVPEQLAAVERVHQYIKAALSQVESGDARDREHQCPVVINCYSGLPWKYGLIAYDAVRSYEAHAGGRGLSDVSTRNVEHAREVDFAPPRIRDYDPDEKGQELWEIVNMR